MWRFLKGYGCAVKSFFALFCSLLAAIMDGVKGAIFGLPAIPIVIWATKHKPNFVKYVKKLVCLRDVFY